MVALVVVPRSAEAADTVQASIVLGAVTPTAATTGDDITVTGVVTNTGTVPLELPQILLWRQTTPLTSRADLTDALLDDPNAGTGSRLTDEGAFDNVTDRSGPLQPGQAAAFSVTAPASRLGFTRQGVYIVGVHLRAATGGVTKTVARARTLLPVTTDLSPRASVSSIVLLTSQPSLIEDGLLADDHLASELTGRLSTLLDAADRPGVTYAIDPALYRTVATMASGYSVVSGSGTTPGTGAQAAAQWLARFATLAPGYRLPYGDLDLALITAHPDPGILARNALATADSGQTVARLPLLVRAANGKADAAFLSTVSALGPSVIVASTSSGASALSSSAGTVLSAPSDPFPAGPGPDQADTTMQYVQRSLADSLLTALDGSSQVRLVTDDRTAALDTQSSAPWLDRVLPSTLTPTTAWTDALSTGTAGGPLTGAVIAPLTAAADHFALLGNLTTDQDGAAALAATALGGVPSASWANDDQALALLAAAASRQPDAASGLKLLIAPKVVMTSRTTAFPVTVQNTLSTPVVVRVVFNSANDARVSIRETDPITVGPGESYTVTVEPKATANGVVEMTAHLTTGAGEALSTSATFTVEANELGRIAWVIVILSAIVVIGGTFLRIRTFQAQKKGEA